jgi:hypothetical protein
MAMGGYFQTLFGGSFEQYSVVALGSNTHRAFTYNKTEWPPLYQLW